MMNARFLKDTHWYIAFLMGIVFWVLYGFIFEVWQFNDLLNHLNIVLFSVFLYPIVEEIVFRGLIQDALTQRFSKQSVFKREYFMFSSANIMTSFLFAIAHLINQIPLWALLTFFPSLIYGYFKDRHQSVLPGLYLHSFYNLGFISLVLHFD